MCCGRTVSAAAPVIAATPRGAVVAANAPLPQSAAILHYLGRTPDSDLAKVPTGSRYRLRKDNTLVVYPADIEALMARLNPDGTPKFERFS